MQQLEEMKSYLNTIKIGIEDMQVQNLNLKNVATAEESLRDDFRQIHQQTFRLVDAHLSDSLVQAKSLHTMLKSQDLEAYC
jgi:hypothetical protein